MASNLHPNVTAHDEKSDEQKKTVTHEHENVFKILREWKLSSYYDKFVENEFFRINDWDTIEKEDLQSMGLKLGSIKTFLKRVKNNEHLRLTNQSININLFGGSDEIESKSNNNNINQFLPYQTASIVFFGETGVGKTTLLASLRDYIKGVKFEDIKKTKRVFGRKEGESQTQNANDIFVKNNRYGIKIIDTPGIGDTQGLEKDKQNIDNICQFFSKEIDFNVIAIVMHGSTNRLTPKVKYILNEIKTYLPKHAQKHFLVILTHATGIVPGKDVIAVIKQLGLPLKNITLINNAAYQEIYFDKSLSKLEKIELEYNAKIAQEESYYKTHNTWQNLLNTICDINKYPLFNGKQIADLHEKRRQLMMKLGQLQSKIKIGVTNEAKLEKIVEHIRHYEEDETKYSEYNIDVTEEQIRYVEDKSKGARITCTICGAYVTCQHVGQLKFGPDIRRFSIINNKGSCTTCGHGYKQHYQTQMWAKTERIVVNKIDQDMKYKHDRAANKTENLRKQKEQHEQRIKEIEQEREKLDEEIQAAYKEIEKIAILGFNEDYGTYIDICIEDIKNNPNLSTRKKNKLIQKYKVNKSIWENFITKAAHAISFLKSSMR